MHCEFGGGIHINIFNVIIILRILNLLEGYINMSNIIIIVCIVNLLEEHIHILMS